MIIIYMLEMLLMPILIEDIIIMLDHNNDFNRRDNFRHYDSMNSSTYKHVNTNFIWIPNDLNIDERKNILFLIYMIGRQIPLEFVFQTLIIRTLMKKGYQSILNIFQVPI